MTQPLIQCLKIVINRYCSLYNAGEFYIIYKDYDNMLQFLIQCLRNLNIYKECIENVSVP